MADDFTNSFRYGLNSLPMEPPDSFESSYSTYGQGLDGMPPPPTPVDPWGNASQSIPSFGTEKTPEGLLTPMSTQRKGPRRPVRRRRQDNSTCYEEYTRDDAECYRRKRDGEYAHDDWFDACLRQAAQRQADCIRNGGQSSKLPVWGPEHEEIWINTDR